MEDEIMTVSGAARMLGRSVVTVRLYERCGKLPAIRIKDANGLRLFRGEDVTNLAKKLAARDARRACE